MDFPLDRNRAYVAGNTDDDYAGYAVNAGYGPMARDMSGAYGDDAHGAGSSSYSLKRTKADRDDGYVMAQAHEVKKC